MKTLGVTGGIGSGKTTVCRLLEGLGARVFYADAEGKRILAEDPSARAAVIDAFGPESYDAVGHLNRAHLAGQVFGDAERLAQLNAIVHPRVRQALLDAQAQAAHDDVPLLVYEAALIYETGGNQHVDAVAVVDASPDLRIRRVTARDEVTPAQVQARMAHQMPPEEKRARADFVILNDGDLDALRAKVEVLYHTLLRDG